MILIPWDIHTLFKLKWNWNVGKQQRLSKLVNSPTSKYHKRSLISFHFASQHMRSIFLPKKDWSQLHFFVFVISSHWIRLNRHQGIAYFLLSMGKYMIMNLFVNPRSYSSTQLFSNEFHFVSWTNVLLYSSNLDKYAAVNSTSNSLLIFFSRFYT